MLKDVNGSLSPVVNLGKRGFTRSVVVNQMCLCPTNHLIFCYVPMNTMKTNFISQKCQRLVTDCNDEIVEYIHARHMIIIFLLCYLWA